MAKIRKGTSTLIIGDAFEKQVLDVLRLLPGTTAQEHVSLGGKNIDALCSVDDVISGSYTVAFECKDYQRPLTREAVTQILADYQPLLTQRHIDRFCLITRNGIVANAKECFDGKTTQHLTYAELLDRLISPRPLVSNMKNRFMLEDLDKYYIPSHCYDTDINLISNHFHLFYNSFMDFALASDPAYIARMDLHLAKLLWTSYVPDANSAKLPSLYPEKTFMAVFQMRRNENVIDLESLIIDWVNNAAIPQAIALLGSYGTGKSSFAKRLAYVWAKRYEEGQTDRIPFLIELRNFGSHQDVMGLITHELINRHGIKNGSYELFQLLNRQGKFLLILDGFDEMKQGLSKDVIMFNFNELNKLYAPRSKVILCGRPTIFSNESEQTSILGGKEDANFLNSVEYIQLQIAPFTQEDILTFLEEYTNVNHKRETSRIRALIDDLRKELPGNLDLSVLLSRPVHLPMLVTILPEWNSSVRDLRRATLYEMFIQKTISREMLKRKQEFQESYDLPSRRKFASELALQMFRIGDSRSIHYAEIPDEVIRQFKHPSQSLDGAKRDLITACFLERKPPDLLFFGHKSFAEFLVAEKIVELMRGEHASTDGLGIRFSPEILSFVAEMASSKDWLKIALSPKLHIQLLDEMLKLQLKKAYEQLPVDTSIFENALTEGEVAQVWYSLVEELPKRLTFRYVEYLEHVSTSSRIRGRCESFLKAMVNYDDDTIAVHAYRALAKNNKMGVSELRQAIGERKYIKWKKMNWVSD